MMTKDNITVSISDWKKIKKEAKKKEKKEYVNIAQPPKIDVMKDSPEEVARKWEEIKLFYKDHPEVDPPWKEWEKKLQFPKLLARKDG